MYQENDSSLIAAVEQQTELESTGNKFEEFDNINIGVVTGCEKLNVRKGPSSTALIVCEIERQTEVMIDESESTEDFYKVCLASGVDGFCMKKFIEVQS